MRKDLELLYKLEFKNFDENLKAITESSGNVNVAMRILAQKDHLKQSSLSHQAIAQS